MNVPTLERSFALMNIPSQQHEIKVSMDGIAAGSGQFVLVRSIPC